MTRGRWRRRRTRWPRRSSRIERVCRCCCSQKNVTRRRSVVHLFSRGGGHRAAGAGARTHHTHRVHLPIDRRRGRGLPLPAGDGLAVDEPSEHLHRVPRLIHRYHVTALRNLDKRERAFEFGDVAGGGSVHDERFRHRGVEGRTTAPLHRLDPPVVSEPVADEIVLPGVDHHAKAAFQHGRNGGLQVTHPISHHVLVHLTAAHLPLAVADAEGGTNSRVVEKLLSE